METQTAIQIKGPGKAEIVEDTPMPKLRDDYIIAKTAAVALNPIDWKQIDYLASPGAIVGCDYSGVVERVGSAVKHGPHVGDRVMGMVHGSNHSNHEDGAFAEHVAAKGDLQIKMPDRMTFEEAATLGAGTITVGQSLYESLELPLPDDPPMSSFPVLIYGGSTATGTLAIQFAKFLGADHIFDYHLPNCASCIREVTQNRLAHVFDTISTPETAEICCNAIGSQGGKYTSLSSIEQLPRNDVVNLCTMAYTAFGEAFDFGDERFAASPKEFDFAVKFMGLAQELLWKGKIKPHPQSVRRGGWSAILGGLQEMREGKVSGMKLVYPV
ncbi:zinc-binding oxidoreductase [Trichoderma cornu-damae]|uniref:Zinc-binding oxidoreductase n=1 Tax=Trichoderma cornu-damae TaxID=654480 RepID=A0A9P8QQ10_9HYPO|nr:zinc-binding oxidoreductase [Trichoderma cornu-damae]